MEGMGKVVAGLFLAVIICYFALLALFYIGIVVMVCVVLYGAFTLAGKSMKYNTIKHCVDRDYNYKMFKVDKEYEYKNKQLEAKYSKSGQRYVEYSVK